MSSIDLSQLPAPNVVQPLDFEAELARLQALVLAGLPELAEVLALESEPINKVLQIVAYENVNMQARINDAARACILFMAPPDKDLQWDDKSCAAMARFLKRVWGQVWSGTTSWTIACNGIGTAWRIFH